MQRFFNNPFLNFQFLLEFKHQRDRPRLRDLDCANSSETTNALNLNILFKRLHFFIITVHQYTSSASSTEFVNFCSPLRENEKRWLNQWQTSRKSTYKEVLSSASSAVCNMERFTSDNRYDMRAEKMNVGYGTRDTRRQPTWVKVNLAYHFSHLTIYRPFVFSVRYG